MSGLRNALVFALALWTVGAAAADPEGEVTMPVRVSKEAPYVNTLGMKFVPVPGTKVLFCIWKTRVQDYEAFAKATARAVKAPGFKQGPTHPATNVSWEDAAAFCAWLSKKEGRTYRLPKDAEWSVAGGLVEEAGSTPEEKDGKAPGYPWGAAWPPSRGAGNYADSTARAERAAPGYIANYEDGYARTSPVGAFFPNALGLYDLGGNLWEWCDDWYGREPEFRVLRGGSWCSYKETNLRSSFRLYNAPGTHSDCYGFRCVLVLAEPGL